MATAIEFENISKQYRLGLVSTRTLSHDLNRWWTVNVRGKEDPYLRIGETNDRSSKGSSDYVWALKDIDFKVEQGDVVGIIGRNGAGKSTLLKLLSRVTAPTTGQIRARGRIGSLLEVGTGFHPEMTGRENIYMNGAILGMTRAEVSRKLDEIVDFSGCERYLDTPVKRYSSGMMVRLGFAVAAHLDPEILVVDEVLAVGDAEFQKKAIGKMKDVSQGEGRTVLFVSHNMASIKSLCKHGILLDQGMVKLTGDIRDVVYSYQNSGLVEMSSIKRYHISNAPGNDYIKILSFEVVPANNASYIDVMTGIFFKVSFMCYKPESMIDVNIRVTTYDDIIMFQTGHDLGEVGEKDSKEGLYEAEFFLPPYTLNAAQYKVALFFGENQSYMLYSGFECGFVIENAVLPGSLRGNVPPGYLRPQKNFNIKYLGKL